MNFLLIWISFFHLSTASSESIARELDGKSRIYVVSNCFLNFNIYYDKKGLPVLNPIYSFKNSLNLTSNFKYSNKIDEVGTYNEDLAKHSLYLNHIIQGRGNIILYSNGPFGLTDSDSHLHGLGNHPSIIRLTSILYRVKTAFKNFFLIPLLSLTLSEKYKEQIITSRINSALIFEQKFKKNLNIQIKKSYSESQIKANFDKFTKFLIHFSKKARDTKNTFVFIEPPTLNQSLSPTSSSLFEKQMKKIKDIIEMYDGVFIPSNKLRVWKPNDFSIKYNPEKGLFHTDGRLLNLQGKMILAKHVKDFLGL